MASASAGTRTDWIANAASQPKTNHSRNAAKRKAPMALGGRARRVTGSIKALRLALEQREQDVVAPRVVDLQIPAREPLATEPVALQQRHGRGVVGDACRFDAMQTQCRE